MRSQVSCTRASSSSSCSRLKRNMCCRTSRGSSRTLRSRRRRPASRS